MSVESFRFFRAAFGGSVDGEVEERKEDDSPGLERQRMEEAAPIIQKAIRSHIFEKRMRSRHKQVLPIRELQRAFDIIPVDPGNRVIHGAPRAVSGTAPVYLPLGEKYVIKDVGSSIQSFSRWHTIQSIRNVMGTDFHHFILPKVLDHPRGYLVEERLPLFGIYTNYLTYAQETALFEPVAREFVRIGKRVEFRDIITSLDGIWFVPRALRVDNIPIIIEKDEDDNPIAKIGLIDTESFKIVDVNQEVAVSNAAFIFPDHVEAIIDEAEKLGILFYKRDVRRAAAEGKEQYNTIVLSPLKHILKHNIGFDNPLRSLTITRKIRKKGQEAFLKEYQKQAPEHSASDIAIYSSRFAVDRVVAHLNRALVRRSFRMPMLQDRVEIIGVRKLLIREGVFVACPAGARDYFGPGYVGELQHRYREVIDFRAHTRLNISCLGAVLSVLQAEEVINQWGVTDDFTLGAIV